MDRYDKEGREGGKEWKGVYQHCLRCKFVPVVCRRLRRGSPLIISVHGIAMETLLRAIEMSDSSTLRINPSLVAQDCASVYFCVYMGVCVRFLFVFVNICMHLGKKFL